MVAGATMSQPLTRVSISIRNIAMSPNKGSHLVHRFDEADGEDGEEQAGDELKGDAANCKLREFFSDFDLFLVFEVDQFF